MTIAQLINGTRESALLRVARFAKQFAKVIPAVHVLHHPPQTLVLFTGLHHQFSLLQQHGSAGCICKAVACSVI